MIAEKSTEVITRNTANDLLPDINTAIIWSDCQIPSDEANKKNEVFSLDLCRKKARRPITKNPTISSEYTTTNGDNFI
jgi:hypothetical protein